MSQSWEMYQWRHLEPSRLHGGSRWGQWRKCTKAEFDICHDPAKVEKRVISCRPKADPFAVRQVFLNNPTIREEWVRAGGSIHGPNVETVTMPAETYYEFRRTMTVDNGNLIDDRLYKALDALYSKGWDDYHQKSRHHPRGWEWQAVIDIFRGLRT